MAAASDFRVRYLAAKREHDRRAGRAAPAPRRKPKASAKDYGASALSALSSAAAPGRTGMEVGQQLGAAIPGALSDIAGYFMGNSPADVGSDVWRGAQALGGHILEHPISTVADFIPGIGDIKGLGEDWQRAAQLRAEGDVAGAQGYERLAIPLALAGIVPGIGEARGAVRAAGEGLDVARAAERAALALPAPPRTLALPAPGPGLPSFAAKPRGGQWWLDNPIGPGSNLSPEAAARAGAADLGVGTLRWVPEETPGNLRGMMGGAAASTPEQAWLEKALTKYYKTDFGSPTDPLRDLAERGLHYDPDMTPEKWQDTVNSYLMEDPIGDYTVPGGEFYNPALVEAAPWLAKQPVTDQIYGIGRGGLDLGHFTDEFTNALNPETSGLPMDFAVRPESLQRMSFPQAVEHVGRINQFRAKQAEEAALSAANSPAVHTFKEYADDNPLGLRWAELKAPEPSYALLDDLDRGLVDLAAKEGRDIDPAHMDEVRQSRARRALEDALRYEGDTMGHCVGGYCPDVMSGRSRIFSLRDAKGEPHVTIETSPGREITSLADIPRDALDQITAAAKADTDDVALRAGISQDDPRWARTYQTNLGLKQREWLRDNPAPEDIVQIKGKQNRAPKDAYLPFVQDFVKSGQWGNVGDFRNTGLVRLPDGRYITNQQAEEGIAAIPDSGVYDPSAFQYMGQKEWEGIAPHFQGYAIGGRVAPDRCFCHHPFSAKG